MVKITISTDNAAFSSGYDEVARILRGVADSLAGRKMLGVDEVFGLYDVNGNRVGEAILTVDE